MVSTHTSLELVKLGYIRPDTACKACLLATEQWADRLSSLWLLDLLISRHAPEQLGALTYLSPCTSPEPTICPGAGGAFEPVMQHFPHNGTQQMNGLLPPIPAGGVESVNYVSSMPGFHEPDLAALNGMSTLEPLQEDGVMGNIITSGFDTATNQRRSNSGSQVWRSSAGSRLFFSATALTRGGTRHVQT